MRCRLPAHDPPPTGTRAAGDGIHLAIDLAQGSALTWVAGELAVAIADLGHPVSLPRTATPSPTLEAGLRTRLQGLMRPTPCSTYHVRMSHYWPQFRRQEVWGDVNAELFVTNYRFRGDIQPLDMWSRTLVTNGVRKLAMSSFCRDSLLDLGVPAERCAVMPLGYAPQIEEVCPDGRKRREGDPLRILVVTNSHDLNRYGSDILIPALGQAYASSDRVEIHIKDYGAASGSTTLRALIAAQPAFPRIVWHETFLAKADLVRLYASMDLMVSPFRGEGFAMKILDAMAIGLPVMMPAFGGPLEFAPPGGFLPLEFAEVKVGPCYDTEHSLVGPGAYWCEVGQDALVAALRAYLRDPSGAEAAALRARDHVFGRYTWRHAAGTLVAALERWRGEQERATAHRRRPPTLPLSVIIPTRDRPEALGETLAAYATQTDDAFEVVVVNDHGDGAAARRIVATAGRGLRVRVFDNKGRPGPGAARNLGIEAADGAILLVAGDDIVPAADLIARHRAAHQRRPEAEAAFVGAVAWHPSLDVDWCMEHIVGAGRQQFDFRGFEPDEEVPFDRFYTSNVSWKRPLTADLEQVFSEAFRHAAYEDVELGYRLSKRGLVLRALPDALGRHLHAMSVDAFLARMRRVGMMRTVFAAMHPYLLGDEDHAFYRDLELERRRRTAGGAAVSEGAGVDHLDARLALLADLNRWLGAGTPSSDALPSEMVAAQERGAAALRCRLFDELCIMSMRLGQADEWARGSDASEWTAAWTAMLEPEGRGSVERQAASPPRQRDRLKERLQRNSFVRAIRGWLREAKRHRRSR